MIGVLAGKAVHKTFLLGTGGGFATAKLLNAFLSAIGQTLAGSAACHAGSSAWSRAATAQAAYNYPQWFSPAADGASITTVVTLLPPGR